MEKLSAQELTLHIAVNLGRLGRWALEGKEERIKQFLVETDKFVQQLESAPKTTRFQETFNFLKRNLIILNPMYILMQIGPRNLLPGRIF